MTTIRAHFDGKVIIPDEPVDLPTNAPLFVSVDRRRPMTGQDLLESGIIGLWKDRTDIKSSAIFRVVYEGLSYVLVSGVSAG